MAKKRLHQTFDEVQAILDSIQNGGAIAKAKSSAEWNAAVGYIPSNGEIIIYTDYKSVIVDGVSTFIPGIKIGTGNAYVQDLAFVGEADARSLYDHVNNTDIHTNPFEKYSWDRKLNVNDLEEVVEDTLILNRN